MTHRPTPVVLQAASPETEYSKPFLQGMLNRMAVSLHKYGPVETGYPYPVNALLSLEGRLREYKRTGNTEYLIDAANFAMIEFMRPRHPEPHFTPTDSDGSPGRTWDDGSGTHDGSNG